MGPREEFSALNVTPPGERLRFAALFALARLVRLGQQVLGEEVVDLREGTRLAKALDCSTALSAKISALTRRRLEKEPPP